MSRLSKTKLRVESGPGDELPEDPSPRPSGEFSRPWVEKCSQKEVERKGLLAHHAATHLIDHGDCLLIGSGTTLSCLMDAIIKRQEVPPQNPLDLLIYTTNLEVFDKGRRAQRQDQRTFHSMQLVLTGGSYHASLHSLVGEYAAHSVRSPHFHPDLVCFGAKGLSFSGGRLTISYQFQEELSTQTSYATRPTAHRVLLCDDSKLGQRSGWQSEEITALSMLRTTPRCTIITTYPDDPGPEASPGLRQLAAERRAAVDEQREAFKLLGKHLRQEVEAMKQAGQESGTEVKTLILRLVNSRGEIHQEDVITVSMPRGNWGVGRNVRSY